MLQPSRAPSLARAVIVAALLGWCAVAVAAPHPDEYIVPEQWREKARVLVDPGPRGLPGDLKMVDLGLANRITVTFEGPPGRLVLDVLPARVAPETVTWKGERLALAVASGTVEGPARDRAVDRMVELLKGREKSWGWLRRPVPDPAAEEEADVASERARKLARAARRAAWMGDTRAAGQELVRLLQAAETAPLDALFVAARAGYRAAQWELGREAGRHAKTRAMRAAAVKHIDAPARRRSRVTLARAAALAGDSHHAKDVVRGTLEAVPALACDLAAVAGDLRLAGEPAVALDVLARIEDAEPGCDSVHMERIALRLAAGELDAAADAAEHAVAKRPGSAAVQGHVAWAALVRGEQEAAGKSAQVAVVRGQSRGEALTVLAMAASAGAVDDVEQGRWDMRAARDKHELEALALGAVACLARGDGACAGERLAALAPLAPHARHVDALRAYAAALTGDAERARELLDAAWAAHDAGRPALAAEAQLLAASGKAEEAAALWRRYADLVAEGPGPVGSERARVIAAGLVRGEPSPEPQPSPEPVAPATAPPAEPEAPSQWPLVLALIVLVGVGGVWAWRRRTAG